MPWLMGWRQNDPQGVQSTSGNLQECPEACLLMPQRWGYQRQSDPHQAFEEVVPVY